MISIRKKDVLQELAVSLYLLLEFFPDTQLPSAVVRRAQEKARTVLDTAAIYTGVIGDKNLQAFIEEKPLHFTIDCGADIVRGDTIRFIEQAYDSRRKPARMLGKRGIIAEVMGISKVRNKPMLHMRVVSSGGTWSLAAGTDIYRTLKIVTRTEVIRVPWEDESQRNKVTVAGENEDPGHAGQKTPPPLPSIKTATPQTLGRYDVLKNMNT